MHSMRRSVRLAAMVAVAAYAGTSTMASMAAVSAEEATQLGGPVLTLFGAEKAGNAEGTIPAYTGEGVKAPPTWNPKNSGQRPDPYGDKPLFVITAQNAALHADKLDETAELFKRYPNFRIDVYPSHRNFVFPQYVLDNTLKNATSCKAVDKELKLEGCHGGIPFPIPKTGNQVMWNHLLYYRGLTAFGKGEAWVVPIAGEPVLMERGDYLNNYPFFDPDKPGPRGETALYYRYLGVDEAPARLVGQKMLLLDPIDQLGNGRKVYLYVPGRRWTKLAADLAYDTINPYSGGAATMDDAQGFQGALDRFDFKLIGKKEKFIYYNNFALNDHKNCNNDRIHSTKGFPNPDCVRWELHRTWAVEANLKPGFRHAYHRRMFYWDEDGYGAGQGVSYDKDGKLYRMINNLYIPYYEKPGGFAGNHMAMDMQSGVWASQGVASCETCGWQTDAPPVSDLTFSPETMTGGGVR